ncbi:unnamed protein product [Urochloa humidicola]
MALEGVCGGVEGSGLRQLGGARLAGGSGGRGSDGHGAGQAQRRCARPSSAPAGLSMGSHDVGQLRRKLVWAWAWAPVAVALAGDVDCRFRRAITFSFFRLMLNVVAIS